MSTFERHHHHPVHILVMLAVMSQAQVYLTIWKHLQLCLPLGITQGRSCRRVSRKGVSADTHAPQPDALTPAILGDVYLQ